MNIDGLTLGQMREIARLIQMIDAAGMHDGEKPLPGFVVSHALADTKQHGERAVVVCTDKRGVVFGYCSNVSARPIVLTNARMCLYWSADVGGAFGLGEKGPTKDCKISATLPSITLEGVTAIMSVDAAAEKAWIGAKVQGR